MRFCEEYRFLNIFLKVHVFDDLRVCFEFMWFVALVISINVLNLTCQFICNSLVLWVIFDYVCFNLCNLNLLNFFCKFCPFDQWLSSLVTFQWICIYIGFIIIFVTSKQLVEFLSLITSIDFFINAKLEVLCLHE